MSNLAGDRIPGWRLARLFGTTGPNIRGTNSSGQCSEDRSPVFVRRGAIIPMEVENDAVNHGSAASKGSAHARYLPGHATLSSRSLGLAFLSTGHPRDRTLVYVKPDERIGNPAGRWTEPRYHPARLRVEGSRSCQGRWQGLGSAIQRADWERTRQGWWFDAKDQRLWIHLPSAQAHSRDPWGVDGRRAAAAD